MACFHVKAYSKHVYNDGVGALAKKMARGPVLSHDVVANPELHDSPEHVRDCGDGDSVGIDAVVRPFVVSGGGGV
eukprot:4916953-Karenia_brevis.AAC.1